MSREVDADSAESVAVQPRNQCEWAGIIRGIEGLISITDVPEPYDELSTLCRFQCVSFAQERQNGEGIPEADAGFSAARGLNWFKIRRLCGCPRGVPGK